MERDIGMSGQHFLRRLSSDCKMCRHKQHPCMRPCVWVPTGPLQIQGHFQTLEHTPCGLCECLMEKFSRKENDWTTKLLLSNLQTGFHLLYYIPKSRIETIWYDLHMVHYKTIFPLACNMWSTWYTPWQAAARGCIIYMPHASCYTQPVSVLNLDITKQFWDISHLDDWLWIFLNALNYILLLHYYPLPHGADCIVVTVSVA